MANELARIYEISIHAPARGATIRNDDKPAPDLHFNPRSREGSDRFAADAFLRTAYFNPRSREGSDQITKMPVINVKRFQSTLPRGERHADRFCVFSIIDISIHAPARGATQSWQQGYGYKEFQSTLPRGERPK